VKSRQEVVAMYIKKYWYQYIGGTDDSLTLVGYLCDKGKLVMKI